MMISLRYPSLCIIAIFGVTSLADAQQTRPIALYDFNEDGGDTLRDVSGVGNPLDLKVENSAAIRRVKGAIVVQSNALITSLRPAKKLIDAIKKSNSISIEAWLRSANDSQAGPSRIVSISADPSNRNVTLGQDKDFYDVRLRTTGTDRNGLPSTNSPKRSLQTKLSHVVFVRDAGGTTTIYVDGKQVARGKASGNFSNWDGSYRLALANEMTKDRPWIGELHRVAIYDQALARQEVERLFAAGVETLYAFPPQAGVANFPSQTFNIHVAPLLAKHCLECHDSAIRSGGLDLSRKLAAFSGGDSGKVIEPGNSGDSLLWDLISSDEMPKGRAPLSPSEKATLRKWLDSGAEWSVELIDPAIYKHAVHSGDIWLQRLTIAEYIETVRGTVGVDIAKEARELLPPDMRADGFNNTSYNLGVDLKHVEAYGKLAAIIVERMDVLKFAARFSKSTKLSTDDTMREHVASMGKWLLRGPLDERDVNNFSGIATTVASAGGDFKQAMTYVIEAMLQSPRFIYRIEDQRGGGAVRPVGSYELASRLSYILWGASPDEELMRAADSGELSERGKVEEQVRRMLNDSRTVERSLQFVSQWLDLERLDNLRPDSKKFPDWDAQLAADMRAETLAYFREVAWIQNRPLSDLLNAQFTFATPQLAKHYGFEPTGTTISRYDVSKVPGRGGLLTQASVLTVGGDGASMVSRGLFVLHDLLRGTINAPPPCVNTTPPPTKAGLTQRGIAEARIADVNCGVCHVRFEPLAFGLEKFDGVGAYHERDIYGNVLRDDGELLFPGEAKAVPYASSAELMDLLAASERVRESLTWKVTQFALGRPLDAADAPEIARIHITAQKDGGTYTSLVTAIVMSDLVQLIRTEKQE
ncbi:MAG: DUF1592 domain-containing protein [Planctomycetaceae bacterium]|nr:DUF1592 domain-containing protein [Planctomycetales bacterium]MCB9927588.1 DUF1592 domain-containing protein [Planctomycetaceae bacterium]